jgi:hypothetical protein
VRAPVIASGLFSFEEQGGIENKASEAQKPEQNGGTKKFFARHAGGIIDFFCAATAQPTQSTHANRLGIFRNLNYLPKFSLRRKRKAQAVA